MTTKLLTILTIFSIMTFFGSANAIQLPSVVDIQIAPTEFIPSTLLLVNNETSTATVTIQREGLAVNWVLLSVNNIDIESGGSYQLPVYYTIPDGTTDGTYSGKLKYTVTVNGSDTIYYTNINFEITKLRHKLWDDFIYIGEKITFGTYEISPVDVSLTGQSCWINFKQDGTMKYDGTIGTSTKSLATGVSVYLTDSLVMTSGKKACRIVVITDTTYTASKSGTQQGLPDDSSETNDVLNIQGTFEQGRTVVLETSSNGALIAGKILIISQINDPLQFTTDGLSIWRVPYNETGAVIIKFYMGSNLIDYKTIILGSEGTDTSQDGSSQGQQTTQPEPPKLIAVTSQKIAEATPIQIEVRNEWGTRVAGVWVKITKPDGTFLSDDTMTDGVVQWNPPVIGWEEGTYQIRISKTGYGTSQESISQIIVEIPRSDVYLRMVNNGTVITQGWVGYPINIEVVNTATGQVVDLDGSYNVIIGSDSIVTVFNNGKATVTPQTNGTMSITIPQTSAFKPTSGSWSITGSAMLGGIVSPVSSTAVGMAFIGFIAIVVFVLIIRKVKGGGKKKKRSVKDRIGFTVAEATPIPVIEKV